MTTVVQVFRWSTMTKKAQAKRSAQKLVYQKQRANVLDSTLQVASPHAAEIGDQRKINQLAMSVTPLQKQTSQSRLSKNKISATSRSSTKRMQLLRSRLSDTKLQALTEKV
jgi:hypothetical protein